MSGLGVGGLGVGGLRFDSAGNLYISDAQSRVYKLTPQGVATVVAGGGTNAPFLGDNGPATSATLLGPSGVAVDSNGNLYISDTLDNRIRKVSTNGTITTIPGGTATGPLGDGGPSTSAVVGLPTGMAVDAAGNLYFADYGHNRVRKIGTDGNISTVAGNGAGPVFPGNSAI